DFGLVGAEALMAGKPLIGVNEGFTRYQVEDGVIGKVFEQTVESPARRSRRLTPAYRTAHRHAGREARPRVERHRRRPVLDRVLHHPVVIPRVVPGEEHLSITVKFSHDRARTHSMNVRTNTSAGY
ncbi:MAG: glycosyltransferase, partial [Halorhabdus sp.]